MNQHKNKMKKFKKISKIAHNNLMDQKIKDWTFLKIKLNQ